MSVNCPPYNNIILGEDKTYCVDHIGGFTPALTCDILDILNSKATDKSIVEVEYILSNEIKSKYPNLDLRYSNDLWITNNFANSFQNYKLHPPINYKNFICSFNGTYHISRKLLVAILQKFGYFNNDYCTKNFSFDVDTIDGHIQDYVSGNDRFYRKFFVSNNSEDFFQLINSFGHVRFAHSKNIYNLESKLTESFIHIVSESVATTYYPFVTEKFLYSVVTRGLFLAYAQPRWHDHLEKYYGFKKYTKLFDYKFDTIQNPVDRLVELITMVSKFSIMTPVEWHDLYLIEKDTIEYNYNHYFSGNYLKQLKELHEQNI